MGYSQKMVILLLLKHPIVFFYNCFRDWIAEEFSSTIHHPYFLHRCHYALLQEVLVWILFYKQANCHSFIFRHLSSIPNNISKHNCSEFSFYFGRHIIYYSALMTIELWAPYMVNSSHNQAQRY